LLKSGTQDRPFYENLWDTILSGQVWSGEIVNRRKDGVLYTEEQTITPVRNNQGEVTHFIAIKQDITERKQTEKKIHHNLERIRALHQIDLVITSTLDLRTILNVLLEQIESLFPYFSALTIRLLNKETGIVDPLAARNIDEEEWKSTRQVTPRGRASTVIKTKAPVVIRNLQTDPRSWNTNFCLKYGLVSYLGVPLIAHDEVLGVLGFYTKEEHDFDQEETEFLTTLAGQAAIAINNSQLYEEMVRANRAKDEFLSVMSHELRTPLNVVLGYTGMIKDGLLGEINPQQQEALEKVMNRANDQLVIINNMLYATLLETEKINEDKHEVSLGDFLCNLKATYQAPINKDLTLEWDCSPDLPAIKTDSAKLKLLMQNLIDNAVKFTNKGSVTISARIRQQGEGNRKQKAHASRLSPHAPNSWVEIKVADTGVGIPKDALPFIFDKFRQVDSSDTRLFGGVGIGLYIVKKITELLGGTIEVESEVGKGSTFRVSLPRGSPYAGKDLGC
jgi:signal transduction histidine kinase